MLNKLKFNSRFLIVIIFTILITTISQAYVFANNSYNLEIKFENIDEVAITNNGNKLDKLSFDIWKLQDNFSLNNVQETIKQFNDMTNSDLDDKIGKHFEKISNIENSSVIIDNLESGIYFVREKEDKDRSQYLAPILIHIYGSKPDIKIFGKKTDEVPGKPKGELEITKLSQSGKKLKGVEFKLFSIGNEEPVELTFSKSFDSYYIDINSSDSTLISDENGKIIVRKLPYGKYILKETKSLEGYRLIDRDIEINIESTKKVEKTIINNEIQPKGRYRFLKISNDANKSPLEGAEFGIFKKFNERYIRYGDYNQVLISDKEGNFSVENLPYGIYYLKELKAPKGYRLNEEYIKFEINENSGKKDVLIITNIKETPPKGGYNPPTGDRGFSTYIYIAAISLILLVILEFYLLRKKNPQKKDRN